jgi:AcrR family transcriptional regulator
VNNQEEQERPHKKRGRSNPKERIVVAAYEILAQKGYDAITFKEIARSAEVAQGLIHYYFGSKDQLLLEVLQEASERYAREMERLITSLPDNGRLPSEVALAQPKARVSRQPEWYRLRYELFALGLRKPELLPGVGAVLTSGRQGVYMVLRKLLGQEIPNQDALAAVMLACFDGLALQKLADSDFDLDSAYRVLDRMIGSVVEDR